MGNWLQPWVDRYLDTSSVSIGIFRYVKVPAQFDHMVHRGRVVSTTNRGGPPFYPEKIYFINRQC